MNSSIVNYETSIVDNSGPILTNLTQTSCKALKSLRHAIKFSESEYAANIRMTDIEDQILSIDLFTLNSPIGHIASDFVSNCVNNPYKESKFSCESETDPDQHPDGKAECSHSTLQHSEPTRFFQTRQSSRTRLCSSFDANPSDTSERQRRPRCLRDVSHGSLRKQDTGIPTDRRPAAQSPPPRNSPQAPSWQPSRPPLLPSLSRRLAHPASLRTTHPLPTAACAGNVAVERAVASCGPPPPLHGRVPARPPTPRPRPVRADSGLQRLPSAAAAPRF